MTCDCQGSGISRSYVVCPKCKGSGRKGAGNCRNCMGTGNYHLVCGCLSPAGRAIMGVS